jgi:hypothetical protein
MRATICVILCLAAAAVGFAQQGHPLTGSWAGDWGTGPTQRTHLTFVLNWDGQKVSGTINPGPDAINLPNVTVDVSSWTIKFEADTKDKSGATVHISVEGKVDNLGSIHRTIKGTWRQGTTTGDFKLTRD